MTFHSSIPGGASSAVSRCRRGYRRLSTVIGATLGSFLLAGCVSTGTFQKKAAEADAAAKELAVVRDRQAELARAKEELEAKQIRMGADLAELTSRNRAMETEKKELVETLKAKEDTSSRSAFELRQRIAELEGANGSLKKELEGLNRARMDEVRRTSGSYEELLRLLADQIAKGQAAVSELKGTLTIDLFEPLLFEPGSTVVKKSGAEQLGRLADYLKTLTGRTYRVEGHTEAVQDATWSLRQFPSGWELGAARAVAITRLLQADGVNPQLLSADSLGEYRPLSDNSTELGRARNRRVAIVLLPKE